MFGSTSPTPFSLLGTPVRTESIGRGWHGTERTIQAMARVAGEGGRDPQVRFIAESLVRGLPQKDYEAECRRLAEWLRGHYRYVQDPRGLEWVQKPRHFLTKSRQGDCFVRGTKVLRRSDYGLVPIDLLHPGDEVWGYKRWSKVTAVWPKDRLATYLVKLNNGAEMRLTPDHKVWVARCPRHVPTCACPLDEREHVRATVAELQPNDTLLQPVAIPFGARELDPDRAYIEGLYVSDGWCEGYRFAISGKDGHPKEAQKHEVQEICARLGVSTSWQPRFIRINDAEWAARVGEMGTHAPEKHLLALDYAAPAALRILDGVLADAGKNTNGPGQTFTTTSRDLWLQTRVLLKMAGKTCGQSYIEEHGGLGKHPIWRLTIRVAAEAHALKRRPKLLRVKEVVRDRKMLECFDITTDDHCVWLPEADWTTSQCDDVSATYAALCLVLGHEVGFRAIKADPAKPAEFSHVYNIVRPRPGAPFVAVDLTEPVAFGQRPETAMGARVLGEAEWVVHPERDYAVPLRVASRPAPAPAPAARPTGSLAPGFVPPTSLAGLGAAAWNGFYGFAARSLGGLGCGAAPCAPCAATRAAQFAPTPLQLLGAYGSRT